MPEQQEGLPHYRYEDIRAMGEAFGAEFPSSETIYPVEEVVELRLGMEVVPIPGLRTCIDSPALLACDFERVWVDDYYYKNRQAVLRFALAHEIGHLRVHPGWYGDIQFESITDWREWLLAKASDTDYGWAENQANCFAGVVLVPGP